MKQLITNRCRAAVIFMCLLRDGGIDLAFMIRKSRLWGGIGAFPCRVMVPTVQFLVAKTLLEDAAQFYDD